MANELRDSGIHLRVPERGQAPWVGEHAHLPGRFYFEERLHQEWDRAVATGENLGLIVVLAADLRAVTQHLGEARSTTLARMVEMEVADAGRSFDVTCRIGDRELAVLAPAIDEQTLIELRRTIEHRVDLAVVWCDVPRQIRVRFDVGAASAPRHAESASELLVSATASGYDRRRRRMAA